MNLNAREMVLLWLTLVAVIVGVTYMLGKNRVVQLKQAQDDIIATEQTIVRYQNKIGSKARLQAELNHEKASLTNYQLNENVQRVLLDSIDNISKKNNLVLFNVDPKDEQRLMGDDVYQFRIQYDFRGNFEAVLRFLFDLQNKGPAMDVQYLSVKPVGNNIGVLSGKLIVNCAYRKIAAPMSAPVGNTTFVPAADCPHPLSNRSS